MLDDEASLGGDITLTTVERPIAVAIVDIAVVEVVIDGVLVDNDGDDENEEAPWLSDSFSRSFRNLHLKRIASCFFSSLNKSISSCAISLVSPISNIFLSVSIFSKDIP